jgi:glucokinase
MILAGDIGGTATRLALFETNGERVTIVAGATFSSSSLSGLGDAIEQFINTRRRTIKAAGFGIAGPVIDGRAKLPNLPWSVDGQELARELGLPRVELLNDLEANAHGIAALGRDDLVPLHISARAVRGNAAIISAGTGLGEAGLYWDGSVHRPFATEAGHADFAPRNELEADLLQDLLESFPTVNIERVLSGAGLYRIYTFLRRRTGRQEPSWLTEAFRQHEGPAAISAAALNGTDETAVAALRLFVSCLGAEAGNLALRMMALGGVYVGGGIAPKILPMLSDGVFISAFVDKGRMRSLLETIPVWVIRNDKTALIGAARYAAKQAQAEPPLAEWATASFARSFAERGAGALQGT